MTIALPEGNGTGFVVKHAKNKTVILTNNHVISKADEISVILFDEFYGYPNWEHQEYKAFKEVFNEKEYKYIAFCASEVAIEIL